MKRFIEGECRAQSTLLPERLDDWIAEDNPVRAVDAFVDELDLTKLGFEGAEPASTGRPAYHPATLLKIYVYGYLNRLPSSRRLERESQRNLELIWLTGRLAPDFKSLKSLDRACHALTNAQIIGTSDCQETLRTPGIRASVPIKCQ